MTQLECDWCLHWGLGWLSGGKPKSCSCHSNHLFTRQYAICYLHIRRQLQILPSVPDPLPFLLNRLPNKSLLSSQKVVATTVRWSAICTLLHELAYLSHEEIPAIPLELSIQLLKRLSQNYFVFITLTEIRKVYEVATKGKRMNLINMFVLHLLKQNESKIL